MLMLNIKVNYAHKDRIAFLLNPLYTINKASSQLGTRRTINQKGAVVRKSCFGLASARVEIQRGSSVLRGRSETQRSRVELQGLRHQPRRETGIEIKGTIFRLCEEVSRFSGKELVQRCSRAQPPKTACELFDSVMLSNSAVGAIENGDVERVPERRCKDESSNDIKDARAPGFGERCRKSRRRHWLGCFEKQKR
eukprot:IDg8961t1